jgi:hypothetical protein
MRYKVIESKHWIRDDGITASLYGSCPWYSDTERSRWKVESRGWTIHDTKTNTVGLGRKPFITKEEAETFVNKLNKREFLK